ncbi:hypothetical protein Tco_0001584 [Tanacetum coccineum]
MTSNESVIWDSMQTICVVDVTVVGVMCFAVPSLCPGSLAFGMGLTQGALVSRDSDRYAIAVSVVRPNEKYFCDKKGGRRCVMSVTMTVFRRDAKSCRVRLACFDHIQYNCPNAYKHMVPRAVLMKTGLKTVKNAKPLSTVRSVNTARPFSTARSVKTVRPYNTAHPKSTVSCARPKSHFQNKAQLTVQRPFYKNTALTKRSNIQNINTGRQTVNTVRPNVNTVRARGFNAVKPSACWVWRPIKPNGASLVFNKYNYIDARGRSKSVMAWVPKAHLSDFKDFDGGYVTFGGGANGGRITGKGTIKTNKLDFEDVYFVKELMFNLFSVSDSRFSTHLYSNPNTDPNRMPLTKAKGQIPQKDKIHKIESMIKRFRKRYSRVVCPNEAAIEGNPGLMRN